MCLKNFFIFLCFYVSLHKIAHFSCGKYKLMGCDIDAPLTAEPFSLYVEQL